MADRVDKINGTESISPPKTAIINGHRAYLLGNTWVHKGDCMELAQFIGRLQNDAHEAKQGQLAYPLGFTYLFMRLAIEHLFPDVPKDNVEKK